VHANFDLESSLPRLARSETLRGYFVRAGVSLLVVPVAVVGEVVVGRVEYGPMTIGECGGPWPLPS
jgi:hypothetical protein